MADTTDDDDGIPESGISGGMVHGPVVQSGVISNIHINGSVNSGHVYQASRDLSLPERRQKFHFDFLNHTLKQAEWTFRLSVLFMTGGSLIILAGGVLALVHAGNPDLSYLPLVTSLTGALITVGGGALALHSKRTMANLTKAAEDNEKKIDIDPASAVRPQVPRRVRHPAQRRRREPPMPAPTFSPDALGQIRRERGVTQRKLAAAIGRDFTSISMYENGRSTPSVDVLAAIADLLGAHMDDFVRTAAELGIGAAHDGPAPTPDSLSAALTTPLAHGTRARARAVAGRMRTDGTTVAAKLLLAAGASDGQAWSPRGR
ncbi:helix-turn-helix domain-containing protein [Streptomyces melanosporofaciens]|uniref:Helix-turn-helix n=1 Tax=Streptomyces melanosporofaciens TaxID=67327 RepID=A0A1H4XN84_STRMJ|nr:helix-turn-helix transcriptional regulator [Streptomyces melanosporofaciens]SED07129.1 Helix-turn-helix [Streptomyces melanosporofaciens]